VALPRAHTIQNTNRKHFCAPCIQEARRKGAKITKEYKLLALLCVLGSFASLRAKQCPTCPLQTADAFETLTTCDDATCRLRKNQRLLRRHPSRLRQLQGFFTQSGQPPVWKCPPRRPRRHSCTPQSLVLYKPPSPKLPVFCCSVLSLALNTDTVPMRTLFGVMRERWDSRTRRNLTASSRLRAPCYSPPSCIESVSIR
jgi:hypothetical protein